MGSAPAAVANHLRLWHFPRASDRACAPAALAAGLPVFFEAPTIVTAGAAERGIERIERPAYPARRPVFERLAWAQWSLQEVAAGLPFRHLLQGRGRA